MLVKVFFTSIGVTIFTIACLRIIREGINFALIKENNRIRQMNAQLNAHYQNKISEVDTLYRIINHIKNQLSLLKLKDCPEEEFKNIPFEIIDWINQLDAVKKIGVNNGVYK